MPWASWVVGAHLLLVLGPATPRWLEARPQAPPQHAPALQATAPRITFIRPQGPPTAPNPSATHAHSSTPTPPASAQDLPGLRLPPSRTLAYALHGNSRGQRLEGDAELAWHHDGRRYEASLWQQTGAGRREMHSTGAVGALGLAPARFGDRTQRSGDANGGEGRRSEQALHFDTAVHASGTPARRVRFSSKLPETLMPEDAQDRLSVLLQLAARVAGLGRPLRPGDRLVLPVAAARWAGEWEFRFEAEERLALAPAQAGGLRRPLPVLRLHRTAAGPHDLDVEVWLAPSLDYLPVRWRLAQDNGDWLEQHWMGADPDPKPSASP